MLILGLTGDIACGKSTVAGMLAKYGAVVLDSDLLVRELYADTVFARQVAALFEASILNDSGEVDRVALGKVVFNNSQALLRLEKLVHPAVARLRQAKIAHLRMAGDVPAVVNEAVKLLESGQGQTCDEVWCVVCAPEVQVRRMVETRGLTPDEAQLRLASQPSRERKRELAGSVPLVWIENDSTLEELGRRVAQEWARLGQTYGLKTNTAASPVRSV